MPPIGRRTALNTWRHPSQVCPYYRPGRRKALASIARMPSTQQTATDESTNQADSRQAQLLLTQTGALQRHPQYAMEAASRQQLLPNWLRNSPAQTQARDVELMSRIKEARCWQQLQSLVDENARSMNYLHVSAVVTHMAQLHASTSTSCEDDLVTGGYGHLGAAPRRPHLRSQQGTPNHRGPHQHDPDRAASNISPWTRDAAHSRNHTPQQQTHAHQSIGPSHHRHQSTQASSQQQHCPGEPGPRSPSPSPPLSDRAVFLVRMERAVTAFLPDFRGRQLANTLWAFAKLGHRPPEAWLNSVLSRVRVNLPTFEPQHLANTLYALMLLKFMPSPAWLTDFFSAVRSQLHGFRPAELAHLCYAGGKLRLQPGVGVLGGVLAHSENHMDKYGVRELALLLYGVVYMGGVLRPDWMRLYRIRVTGLIIESGALSPGFLARLAPHLNLPLSGLVEEQLCRSEEQRSSHRTGKCGSQARSCDGQEVQGTVAHRGRNGAAQPSMQSAADQAALSSYLPTVLLSMGKLGYHPPPVFLSVVLAAVGRDVRQLDALNVTSLLLGLAFMHYRPRPEWFQRVWSMVMTRLDYLTTQQRVNVLWAAARLRCPVSHSDAEALLLAAAADLPEHSDAEVVALLQAFAGLGIHPRRDWMELVESHLYRRLPEMQPFEVAVVLPYLTGMGHKPHRVWMARWAESLCHGLPELGLQHVAWSMEAAARLGYRPPARLCAVVLSVSGSRLSALVQEAASWELRKATADGEQLYLWWQCCWKRRLQQQHAKQRAVGLGLAVSRDDTEARMRREGVRASWSPDGLCRLLWALAMLDVRPDEQWMTSYVTVLRMVLDYLDTRDLSLLVWSLARLRYDPGPELMAAIQQRAQYGGREPQGADQSAAGAGAFEPVAPQGEAAPIGTEPAGTSIAGSEALGAGRLQRESSLTEQTDMTMAVAAPDRKLGLEGAGADSGRDRAWQCGAEAGPSIAFSRIILQGLASWAVTQLPQRRSTGLAPAEELTAVG